MTSKELKSILTENKITLTTMQKKSICIFNLLVLVGVVRMSDRIIKELTGL